MKNVNFKQIVGSLIISLLTEISASVFVINQQKRFKAQWNLRNEFAVLGFKKLCNEFGLNAIFGLKMLILYIK